MEKFEVVLLSTGISNCKPFNCPSNIFIINTTEQSWPGLSQISDVLSESFSYRAVGPRRAIIHTAINVSGTEGDRSETGGHFRILFFWPMSGCLDVLASEQNFCLGNFPSKCLQTISKSGFSSTTFENTFFNLFIIILNFLQQKALPRMAQLTFRMICLDQKCHYTLHN